VPFGTKSTFSRTSRIIADMEIPSPLVEAPPDGGPIGVQAKITIAANPETMRTGDRTDVKISDRREMKSQSV
jgi:hypothetical protein